MESSVKETRKFQGMPQPLGTVIYKVQNSDSLASIAAQCDVSVSVLKKLNRMMTETIFPSQVLYIPGPEFASFNSFTPSSPTEKLPVDSKSVSDTSVSAGNSHPVSEQSTSPVKAAPGHAERQTGKTYRSVILPRALSEDEVKKIDEECHERFVKMNAKYITPHEEEVPGVLLVTPDAVMFDADEHHPLVLQRGREEFQLVESIMSVEFITVYHGSSAMKYNRNLSGLPDEKTDQEQNTVGSANHQLLATSEADQLLVIHDNHFDSPRTRLPPDILSEGMTVVADSMHEKKTSSDAEAVSDIGEEGAGESVVQDQVVELDDSAVESVTNFDEDGVVTKDGFREDHFRNPGCETAQLGLSDVVAENQLQDTGGITAGNHLQDMEDIVARNQLQDTGGIVAGNQLQDTGNEKTFQSEESELSGQAVCMVPDQKYDQSKTATTDTAASPGFNSPDCETVVRLTEETPTETGRSSFKFFSPSEPTIKSEVQNSGTAQSCKGCKARELMLETPVTVFLCLKVHKNVESTKALETTLSSPTARFLARSEYWYSIPCDKVDSLYAFFVQWTTETGDKGFVVVETETAVDYKKYNTVDGQKLVYQINKDWEIVNVKEYRHMLSEVEIKQLPLPDLSERSQIMETSHIAMLICHLPPIAEGNPWKLVYSTSKHGFSLMTLYRLMQQIDSPIFLIIQDSNDQVFGAMISCALKMSDHFYGSGESYLFTFCPEFKKFGWTGINSFFVKGNRQSLAVGASEGSNGLWLDGDLYHGRTQPCLTFDNELLTVCQDFTIKCLETWYFG